MLHQVSPRTRMTPVGLYWEQLKALDSADKLELINMLSASLLISAHTPRKNSSLDTCFGAWQVPAGYTDTDLLRDIDTVCADRTDFVDLFK